MKKIIYLDNAATTCPDTELLQSATEYAQEFYYNPSALYSMGRKVREDINFFKKVLQGKNLFKKVIITSCGTESDNTAIFGFAKRGNAVTTNGEHSAVYNSFMKIKEKGIDTRFAALNPGGAVNIDDLLSKVDRNTSFVSVVHVNNETGAINPINEIAKEVKSIAPKAIFHSDGVQAYGKIDYALSNDVDLYSASAHKIGGIKGVGLLLANEKLNVPPYIIGGGQENGVRSGTENFLGIKLFADVYNKNIALIKQNLNSVKQLKSAFLNIIDKNLFKILSPDDGSPYIVCLSAYGLRGAVLQNILDDEGILIGTGSACSSKKPFSRVISSFENDVNILNGVVRISFAANTKLEDVEYAANRLNFNALKLKEKIVI